MDVLQELLQDPVYEAPAGTDVLEVALTVLRGPHGRAFLEELLSRCELQLPPAVLAETFDPPADPGSLAADVKRELDRREEELTRREATLRRDLDAAQQQLRDAPDPAILQAEMQEQLRTKLAENAAVHEREMEHLRQTLGAPVVETAADSAKLQAEVEDYRKQIDQHRQQLEQLSQANTTLAAQNSALQTTMENALKVEAVAAPVRKGARFEGDFFQWVQDHVISAAPLDRIKCENLSNKSHHADLHFTLDGELLMIVDLKHYNKNVPVSQAMKLRSDMRAQGAPRGMIVSKDTCISNGDNQPVDGIKVCGDVVEVGNFVEHVEETAMTIQTLLHFASMTASGGVPDEKVEALEAAALCTLVHAQDMKRKATANLKLGVEMFDSSADMIDQINADLVTPLHGRVAKRRKSKVEAELLAKANARLESA